MFRLLRFLVTLVVLGAFVWFAMTVPLGRHTLYQHVRRIWNAPETKEMVDGAKEKIGPAVEKTKRAVKAGVEEAKRP